MSEEIKPVATEEPADVAKVEQEAPVVEQETPVVVNYAEKKLAELTELFQQLTESEDRMKRSKEADAIKSPSINAFPRIRRKPAKTLPWKSRMKTRPWKNPPFRCRAVL